MRQRTTSLPGDVVVVELGSEINIDKQQQQQQQQSLASDINKLGTARRRRSGRQSHWQDCNQFNQQQAQPYFLDRRQRDYCRRHHRHNSNNNHKHSLGSWQTGAAELSPTRAPAPLGGGREPRRRYGASTTPTTFTTTTTTTTLTATSSSQNNTSSCKCYRWRRATLGSCSRRWLDCNNYDTTTKTKALTSTRLATTSRETLCLCVCLSPKLRRRPIWRRHSSLAETSVTSVCHAPPLPLAAPSSSASASAPSLPTEAAAATTEAAGKTLASLNTNQPIKQAPSTGVDGTQGAPPQHKQSSGSKEVEEARLEFGAELFGVGGGAQRPQEARQVTGGGGGGGGHNRSGDAMDILQHQPKEHQHHVASALPATLACHQLPAALTRPKIYPNNTLLADLSKCHRNIGQLWPTAGHQLVGCWPLTWRRYKWKRPRLNYHMPDALLRNNPTLTLDDYDKAISVLTGDVRYQLHLLLYKRVQTLWILLTTLLCTVLPVLLLANLETLMVTAACLVWLSLQIIGAFVTTRFRTKLDEMLEKSVAQVNTFFMDHNLMLGVIHAGSLLSKSRLIIPMLYFDTSQCREQIESIISIDSRENAAGNVNNNNSEKKHILDYSKIGLPTGKPNAMALAQSQLAKKIVLRYSQRWISLFDRRKLMFTDDRIQPRHLSTGKCLCQFIEEHFKNNNTNTNNTCDGHQQQEANGKTTVSASKTIAQQWRRRRRRRLAKIRQANGDTQQVPNGKQTTIKGASEPIVIGKKDARFMYQMAIPTLSKLVSAKEFQNHHKIDMSAVEEHHHQVSGANGYHGHHANRKLASPEGHQLLANIEHNYFNYHYQNYYNQHQQQHSPTSNGLTNHTSTTISSADISLENGGENVISRSDELVRKLRLLLELRKNELQSFDGSLFSAVLYKAPQQIPTELPTTTPLAATRVEMMTNGDNNNLTTNSGEDEDQDEDVGCRRQAQQTVNGNNKRFYNQREGLFFLSTNAAKKSQHQQQEQQQTNRNHILEIC